MNEFVRINNTDFNAACFVGWDKKKFIEEYKGKVSFDLSNAWLRILQKQKELGLYGKGKKKILTKDDDCGCPDKNSKERS